MAMCLKNLVERLTLDLKLIMGGITDFLLAHISPGDLVGSRIGTDMSDLSFYMKFIWWYLKRPGLYPDLIRRAGKTLSGTVNHSNSVERAVEWCQECAGKIMVSFNEIMDVSISSPVREIYPDIFGVAERTVRNCPVTLGGPGNLDLLYWIAEFIQANNVIETGVAYGWSSLALLLSLSHRKKARLVSTDMPYQDIDLINRNMSTDSYVGCVVPQEYKNQWRIIRQADREALPKALGQFASIDLCHYDSDKSYEGRMWAYPRLWEALRSGGYFISDDIGDNLAFHDFCRGIGYEPMVIETPMDALNGASTYTKYVGILRKSNDDVGEEIFDRVQ